MSVEFKIVIENTSGVAVAQITDYLALSIAKQVKAPGALTFDLLATSPYLGALQTRYFVKVYRRNLARNLDWYLEFVGLVLGITRQYTDHEIITVICPGILWLLNTRIVAFYEGLEGSSMFTAVAAETILKTLVDRNAGSAATTANGRIRNGTISGITIETDAADGFVLNWQVSLEALLDNLQKVAEIAGGDFDLVETAPATYEFRWYAGQRGTDRTATVKFSLGGGNMGEPEYSYMRQDEKTVAIVGGQGSGPIREFATASSAGAATNDAEVVVNATDVAPSATSQATLEDRGSAYLERQAAQQTYNYNVVQTSGSYYGRDYTVGDLVTGVLWFSGAEITQKILGANIDQDNDGNESIEMELQTLS